MMTDIDRHREIEEPDIEWPTEDPDEVREESDEVREERAEHAHEVALLDAPDAFPWGVFAAWTAVIGGALYLTIQVLRVVL